MSSFVVKRFSPSIISPLIARAQTSNVDARLASAILKNGKMVTISNNQDRSMLRGVQRCSLHAEMSVLRAHYGSSLKSKGKRYCILREKRKKKEG